MPLSGMWDRNGGALKTRRLQVSILGNDTFVWLTGFVIFVRLLTEVKIPDCACQSRSTTHATSILVYLTTNGVPKLYGHLIIEFECSRRAVTVALARQTSSVTYVSRRFWLQ